MKVISAIGLMFMIGICTAGCSISLAGMTALDEARARREARISTDELKELEPGTKVRIHLVDGTSEAGLYLAIRQVSSEQVLQINQNGQTTDVPLVRVDRIDRQRRKYSFWPALAFGGAIDAAVLVIFFTT